MSFSSIRDMIDESYSNGKMWYSTYRKVPAIASVQGNWVDLSMAPGNPRPNFYSGDERTATERSYLKLGSMYGLNHGVAVTPGTKHLHKIGIASLNAGFVPATFTLCDYLLFYPIIDMDSDAPQELYNYPTAGVPALPRYADGVGVQAFLVALNPYVGNAYFNITYTNSSGVEGKVSQVARSNASTYISTIVNAGLTTDVRGGPFIPLAVGDNGIRSVQSIKFDSANGGLAALVLVKPLATFQVREITTWCEFDFFLMKGNLPRIYDGAYLNFLCMPNGNVTGQYITGDMTFIWG